MTRSRSTDASAGFSILEGLVALTLTGLVMAGVSMLVAQWMPLWNRGFHAAQKADLIAVALDRITADLAEARYVKGSDLDNYLFFSGRSEELTFVRPILDPGERTGLEVVRITTVADKAGARIVRRQARFTPLPPGVSPAQDLRFSSTAVLLQANARLEFIYADGGGGWRRQWDDPITLPTRIRIVLRDPASGAEIASLTTAIIHIDAPARCATASSVSKCSRLEQPNQGQQSSAGGESR